MLTIKVPEKEFWDSEKNQFCYIKGQELQLEHSLISVSKWESKWHIPFLNDNKRTKDKFEKTNEMLVDYVRCMTINKVADNRIFFCLTKENMNEINEYINDPMTATTFSNKPSGAPSASSSYVTAEVIYYQMFELGIPLEWEKRHLNRLFTLIRVISEKKEQANNPKKMSSSEIAKQNRALHAARKKPHIPRV